MYNSIKSLIPGFILGVAWVACKSGFTESKLHSATQARQRVSLLTTTLFANSNGSSMALSQNIYHFDSVHDCVKARVTFKEQMEDVVNQRHKKNREGSGFLGGKAKFSPAPFFSGKCVGSQIPAAIPSDTSAKIEATIDHVER